MIIQNEEGEDVTVFTADELAAAKAEVESEYKPKLETLEGELGTAKTALAARANEFSQFRKLSDEQVTKLSEAERTIYENGLTLAKANEDRIALEKTIHDSTIDNGIKAKVGDNAALFEEVKRLWPLVTIDANTPEEIATKTLMVLGMISTQKPDLVATSNGFGGGSFQPPAAARKDGESFADTEEGKGLAASLGLVLETPKK